jgi:hypothetical protein
VTRTRPVSLNQLDGDTMPAPRNWTVRIFAARVVDIRKRHDEGNPQPADRSTAAVRTIGATSGSSPHFAARPPIRNRGDQRIDLAPLTTRS